MERSRIFKAGFDRMRMRVFAFLCLLCMCLAVVPASVPGQTDFGYLDERQRVFFVDQAAFREAVGEKFRLEVYYKIFSKALTFVKQGDRFKASYEVQLVVSNKVNKQVTGTSMEESYVVDTYGETRSPSDFLVNQLPLSLYSGRYKLRMKLVDNNSGTEFELERDFIIPSRMKKKMLFSDIEFIRQVSDGSEESRFNKRGNMVIPSVSRSYGDADPVLMFYYEIYGETRKETPYVLIYQIRHLHQAFSYEETSTVTLSPEVFAAFDSVSLEDFPSGDYSLKVALLEKGQEKAKIEQPFRVDWSFVNQLKNEYLKAIEQLRYVASSDEMKELREAPEEERMQKWLEFWNSKDPTPGTPENELRDEYHRRLRYVNENFALPTKEGWETDMGMIYMIYGHPDEVEKHPFDRDRIAYQIWYYYKKNLVFRFEDRGDGEYELQPPYDGKYRYYRGGY
jgi:GWxTD domain-containing protein